MMFSKQEQKEVQDIQERLKQANMHKANQLLHQILASLPSQVVRTSSAHVFTGDQIVGGQDE